MGTFDPQSLNPRLATLLDYWKEKCAGRAMPSRGDIDPIDLPDLLRSLLLIDIEPLEGGDPHFRVRLAGTEIVERYGEDYTGRYLHEIDFGDQRPQILADFAECAATAMPHRGERLFWNTRGVQFRMERLILPLGADGETPDMLMAGLHFEELRKAR